MEGAMPRERITTTDDNTPFDVQVSWHRDTGTVQVTTTAFDGDQRLRDWVEVDPKTGEGTPAGSSFKLFDGWPVNLDRARLNQLIRLLRTARDQTFGRDE
jgi:hypothetical protein